MKDKILFFGGLFGDNLENWRIWSSELVNLRTTLMPYVKLIKSTIESKQFSYLIQINAMDFNLHLKSFRNYTKKY